MLRPRQGLILAILLLALASLSRADDVDRAAGSISITATRIPESASAVPPEVTIVGSDEIEARGARTLADAIETVPGVTISDEGPKGAQQAVSIRGSTSNEVLILVDGVRANDAMSELADLSAFSADDIDRIEVVRDGASALYGGDAVGGVINIITKKKASPLVLTVENGSYLPGDHVVGYGFSKTEEPASASSLADSQKLAFSWGPQTGDTVFRSSGSFTRAANGYTFLDSDGEARELQNAALLGGDLSLGLAFPCWDGSLDAQLSGGYDAKGSPGSQASPTLAASEEDSSARASIKYATDRFLSDSLGLEATVHAEYKGLGYSDAEVPANDSTQDVFVGGLDLQQTCLASPSLSWVYGISTSGSAVSSDTVGSPSRIAAGAFAEAAIEAGKLSLRPALRYDYYSDFFANDPLGGLGATLAAAFRLSDKDVLKLNLSRAYRVPSFEDLYWPASNGSAGNPALQPETAYAADLGYERDLGALTYVATAYARYSKDVILWAQGSDEIWRPSNFGAAFYPGLEQELRTTFAGDFWTSVNYSLLYSYLLDSGMTLADDKRAPMTPVHTLNAVLGFAGKALSWSVTAKYESLRYLTTGNTSYLPSHFTVDGIVKREISKNLTAYLAVDNLFDEQYEMVEGYPMPGTELRLGIEIRQ
jgi:outer membrane cobalamin receptor